MHLVRNALAAIDRAGIITLRTRTDGDRIVVEVAGSGRGIEADRLTTLFEPQLSNGARRVRAGLGLFISNDVVPRHEGTLTAESEPGGAAPSRSRYPCAHSPAACALPRTGPPSGPSPNGSPPIDGLQSMLDARHASIRATGADPFLGERIDQALAGEDVADVRGEELVVSTELVDPGAFAANILKPIGERLDAGRTSSARQRALRDAIAGMRYGAAVRRLALLALAALGACVDPGAKVEPAATGQQASVERAPPPKAGAARERLAITPSHARIEWVGAKATREHPGRFSRFAGELRLDPQRLERSEVEVRIQIASLVAEPQRLADHLRSVDFLDADRFPHATFRSVAIAREVGTSATHRVSGDLALHGETRRVTFPATVKLERERVSVRAEFSINRLDFGIAAKRSDAMVRERVAVRLELDLPREGG